MAVLNSEVLLTTERCLNGNRNRRLVRDQARSVLFLPTALASCSVSLFT
jgi:hypothetical protein